MLPSANLLRALDSVQKRLIVSAGRKLNLPRTFSSIPETKRVRFRKVGGPPEPKIKRKPKPGPLQFFRHTEDPSSWDVKFNPDDKDTKTLTLKHTQLDNTSMLPRAWLRDACPCDACVNPSSGQKGFSTADIPVSLPINNAVRSADGSLEVSWENDFLTDDIHVSRYPSSMIDGLFQRKPAGHPFRRTPWDKGGLESLQPFFDYSSFIAGEQGYYDAMKALTTHGIFILRGVPSSEEIVEQIAAKIGILQDTFYGRTWDVVSKPAAENVAYTNDYLGLHQDLLYMCNVPRVQILHCLKNTCEGGESIFSDGLRTRQEMIASWPSMAALLTTQPVKFHYNKGGHFYSQRRPVISSDDVTAYWSPPFQHPIQQLPKDNLEMRNHKDWLKAIRKFQEVLEAEKYVFEYKLKEGDCVVFDNIRVMHGRRQFDPSSGERWLKGAYVENSSYNSKRMSIKDKISTSEEL